MFFSPASLTHHAQVVILQISSPLLSRSRFFFVFSFRFFRLSRDATGTHHVKSDRHGPPSKIQFASALLWGQAEKPLSVSAMVPPWPIFNNTEVISTLFINEQ